VGSVSLLALFIWSSISVHPMSTIRGPLDPRLFKYCTYAGSWLHVNCAVTFKSHNASRSAAIQEHQIFLDLPDCLSGLQQSRKNIQQHSAILRGSFFWQGDNSCLPRTDPFPWLRYPAYLNCNSELPRLVQRPRTQPHAVPRDPKRFARCQYHRAASCPTRAWNRVPHFDSGEQVTNIVAGPANRLPSSKGYHPGY
jgi:hypothetical protein